MRFQSVLVSLFSPLLCAFASEAAATSLQVTTSSGTFEGIRTSNGTERWLGIRFAEPPVGKLRFAAPVPVTRPATGVQLASTFGNACPQPAANLGAPVSEDCLFFNVWRPNGTSSTAKLPILVWFYVS